MKRVIGLSIIVAAAIHFSVPAVRAVEKRDAMPSQQDMREKMEMIEKIDAQMVYIKGGCFMMGSNAKDKEAYAEEKPVHEVCVSDFYIGKYEITQGQWQAVMGSNPSKFSSCGTDCPVEQVSWNEVQDFINELNRLTGKKYRLPTESEWEYACRSGGKNEKYSGTNDDQRLVDYAWYDKNSDNKTHKVGTKKPNGLGIFDMSGNVDEWVEDAYAGYSLYSRNNPINKSGSIRVVRGGGWRSKPERVRATNRNCGTPDSRYFLIFGFRLARTP